MAKNETLNLFRDSYDAYDAWGSVLNAHFDVAHTIAREHGIKAIPADWGFRLGASGAEEPESIFSLDIQGRPLAELVTAGTVLGRLTHAYEEAGLSY